MPLTRARTPLTVELTRPGGDSRAWPAPAVLVAGRQGRAPDRPLTGYNLRAVLSADGATTGFGLTLGATRVYGAVSDAAAGLNRRHAPPRRCVRLRSSAERPRRSAVPACANGEPLGPALGVAALPRYIRYERGLRYSRQRVRAILGRPVRVAAGLAPPSPTRQRPDRLASPGPRSAARARGQADAYPQGLHRAPLTAPSASRPCRRAPRWPRARRGRRRHATCRPVRENTPIAVPTAEIALLHARLDDLQSRLDK